MASLIALVALSLVLVVYLVINRRALKLTKRNPAMAVAGDSRNIARLGLFLIYVPLLTVAARFGARTSPGGGGIFYVATVAMLSCATIDLAAFAWPGLRQGRANLVVTRIWAALMILSVAICVFGFYTAAIFQRLP